MKCNLCPRRCNADRENDYNLNGFCKMPLLPKAARASLHFWEEPVISGKNGSGTVFFSGCSLTCVYCQNYKISHEGNGKIITPERLAEIFRELEEKGAHNINLVNPTHFVLSIKEALDIYRPNIPIVYNSSGYESEQTIEILRGYIDIYLLDFKYYSNEKAAIYSSAPDYVETAKLAIQRCYQIIPECVIEEGIMKKGIIVRHLLLPKATNDAIKIFDWVRRNTPNVYFSFMGQYLPLGKANEYKIIDRPITKREYSKVLSYIEESGFDNVFYQELSSADDKYVPEFDLSGI